MPRRKFIEDSDEDDGKSESPALTTGHVHAWQSQDNLGNPQSSHAAVGSLDKSWSIDASTESSGMQLTCQQDDG